MAMKKISEKNGIRIYVGRLSDNTDEFNMAYSAEIPPSERVDGMCRIAEDYFRMKGIDLDARRLDRSVQVIRNARSKPKIAKRKSPIKKG